MYQPIIASRPEITLACLAYRKNVLVKPLKSTVKDIGDLYTPFCNHDTVQAERRPHQHPVIAVFRYEIDVVIEFRVGIGQIVIDVRKIVRIPVIPIESARSAHPKVAFRVAEDGIQHVGRNRVWIGRIMQVFFQRVRIITEQARVRSKPHKTLLILDHPSGIRHGTDFQAGQIPEGLSLSKMSRTNNYNYEYYLAKDKQNIQKK
jgi:hypothetical protein